MPKFAHLHTHSHYSLLEALPFVKGLVKHAKGQGCEALALTDNGNMFGAIEFVQACEKEGIKPIIGMDAYVAIDTLHDKRHRVDNTSYRLVLLAENMEGYRNLMQLASIGFLDGFYYRPRIDRPTLRERARGLIALQGGRGDVYRLWESGDEEQARKRLAEYVDIFGKDNFFFELNHQPDNPAQAEINDVLRKLAGEAGIGTVAARNSYYLNSDDAEARRLLLCIKDQRTIEERSRYVDNDPDLSLSSPEEIIEAFKDDPASIENVVRIVERCDVKLDLGKWNFPQFEIPDGLTADDYLKKLSYEGLEKNLGREPNGEEVKRLEYELDVVRVKGYSTYFLVVADYTSWSTKQGIVSTTRGSAAGSLMGYAIGISSINPLTYHLPFERFLNPLRPSAPDIDSDFADNRRGEVLEYVKQKYGHDHVAQICTFGTMAARGSVRDTGRALGYPVAFCDQVAKLIPFGAQGFAMTIDRALKETPDLKKRYDEEPDVRRMLDLARQIEGRARQCSIHAAGVVISDKPLVEYTPLQREAGGENIITQYEMKSVEAAGVLKMDFLGIRNLSILGNAIEQVKRSKGVDIDITKIPLDDEKVFSMLARGETMGVFQLSGDGMTKWLVQLKPTDINDIMAMVALFRPGPMESIPEYIERKYDPKKVAYLHPKMKDYLGASYGLLVYQDDVMLTAIHLAGYDWLEADKFRKAMGKKIPEEMAKQEIKFREGCKANSVPQKVIDELWERIKPFAAYGFNKAHAASYGMVAYQTAYLKANYPAEYMAALMTAESHDLETVAYAVAECRRVGIEVLPPDVNESLSDFTYIDDTHIRFGLTAIKNLGEDTIASIIEEREAGGKFTDLADFASRLHGKSFNKKSVEALAKSGAMDSLAERAQIIENLDILSLYNKNARKDAESGQTNLFAIAMPEGQAARAPLVLRNVPPADLKDILLWEKELLGLYVTAHPFGALSKEFAGVLAPIASLGPQEEREPVQIGGVVLSAKQIQTKAGEPMAFVNLEDETGSVELVVFPRVFKEHPEHWVEGAMLAVRGKISKKDDETKVLADNAYPLTPETIPMYRKFLAGERVSSDLIPGIRQPEKPRTEGEVHINLPSRLPPEARVGLKTVLAKYPGKAKVCLFAPMNGRIERIETAFLFDPTTDALLAIEKIVGMGNVKALLQEAPS